MMDCEKGYAVKCGFQWQGRVQIREFFLEKEKQTLGLHHEPTGRLSLLLDSLP